MIYIYQNNQIMKNYTLLSILLILVSLGSQAQDSIHVEHKDFDRIVMINGEIKEGHVTSISADNVSFIYTGETLQYQLAKKEIGKIEFSSGRIEQMNPIVSEGDKKENMVNHANKIAILPVIYVKNGAQVHGDIMEEKAQAVFFQKLNDHAGYMVVQDPVQTNSNLKKSGLSLDELTGLTMPEIANVLGVEYVVKTILTIDKQGERTYTNTSGSVNKTTRGLSSYSSSSSSSTVQYKTTVEVSVYNDHGENTFSRSKMSLLTSKDAYPLTMGFLTKKMPFYTK